MPEGQVDPARLEGEALRRWYMRSRDEIEQERQAHQARRYEAFFGAETAASRRVAQPAQQPIRAMDTSDDDILWMANGRGGYRAARRGADDFETSLRPPQDAEHPDYLPANSAANEGGELLEIGNPHNRRLRREYIREKGSWPRTEDGRNFHVGHIKATADGGSQTLDNIQPVHPDEHMAEHSANGDFARFARRASTARAFGGTVEPPAALARPRLKPRVNGLGLIGILPGLAGLLSGSIRTDTPTHTWYDLAGFPAPDDYAPRPGEVV